MSTQHIFLREGRVSKNGPFRALEMGREASGHGLYLDAKTGAGIVATINAMGGKVKAYATHDHRGPGSHFGEPGSEIGACVGVFSGAHIVGSVVFFDSFEWLPSYKRDEPTKYARLSEMIEREVVTLSLELSGTKVFIDKTGAEHLTKVHGAEYLHGGLPTLRVDSVYGCAFVSVGAATSSLFSRIRRAWGGFVGHEKNPWAAETRNYTEQCQIAQKDPELARELAEAAGQQIENSTIPSKQTTLLDSIRTHFGSDSKRMVRALEIMANETVDDVGAIERTLFAQDVRSLTSQLAKAESDLASANSLTSKLIDERDDWKKKFFQIKDSGAPAVDLGFGGAAGAACANPWAKGSLNYTEQSKIAIASPEMARQMQAAAGIAAW